MPFKCDNSTGLSKHLWKVNNENKQYKILWKILHCTKTSRNPLSLWSLCNLERAEIANVYRRNLLNIRNELVKQCLYHYQYLQTRWFQQIILRTILNSIAKKVITSTLFESVKGYLSFPSITEGKATFVLSTSKILQILKYKT